MTADHGIIMSDPMMRAVLAGEKTVTRRTSNMWARAREGDRLWFREVWKPEELGSGLDGYRYRCDGAFVAIADTEESADRWSELRSKKSDVWRSSLFMPRSVCRATGIVTSIRQEPLQDITENDARREGMAGLTWADVAALKGERKALALCGVGFLGGVSCRQKFQIVFRLLSNSEVWQQNPLVWRVEWERE